MKAWENNIRKVEPYVPGEQPKEKNIIKLNTNENPYPPSPKVSEALREFNTDRMKLYPDPDSAGSARGGLQAYRGIGSATA